MRGRHAGDVEAVDLEPIALDGPAPTPPPRRARPAVIAAVALTVGAVWGSVAFATRGSAHHASTPPTSTEPAPTTVPDLPGSFVTALKSVGSGRFATIVHDHLYVVDARADVGTPVDLGVPAQSIEARSGAEVLVSTPDGEVIVDTTGLGLEPIPIDRRAFSSFDGMWWIVDNDGLFTRNGNAAGADLPNGMFVAGTTARGFVATSAGRYVLWSRYDGIEGDLGPTANRSLLATGATWVAFATTCNGAPCDEVLETDGAPHEYPATGSGNAVAVSPDGGRIAVGQQVVDAETGRGITTFAFPLSTTGVPFTWTPDSTLVVTRDDAISVLRPNDREVTELVRLAGLRQVVALP